MTAMTAPVLIPTRSLFWDPETRRYSVEASELDRRVGAVPTEVVLVGNDGRKVWVGSSHMEVDAEGDVRWWDYTPADPAQPFAGLRVWND